MQGPRSSSRSDTRKEEAGMPSKECETTSEEGREGNAARDLYRACAEGRLKDVQALMKRGEAGLMEVGERGGGLRGWYVFLC